MRNVWQNGVLCKTAADSFNADEQENEEETCAFRTVAKDPYSTLVYQSQQNCELRDRWYR